MPAGALRSLPHARFYITRGAAHRLRQRQLALWSQCPTLDDEHVAQALIDLSLACNKRLLSLSEEDADADPMAAQVRPCAGNRGRT